MSRVEDIKTQVEGTLLDLYLGKNRVGFNGRKLNDKKQMENPALQEATTQILSLLTDEMAKYQKELKADYDEDIREARVEELEQLVENMHNSEGHPGVSSNQVRDRIKELKDRGYDKLPVIEVDADDVSDL